MTTSFAAIEHIPSIRSAAGFCFRWMDCERWNVVVVRSGGGRRWFGLLTDDDDVAALAAWIHGGADPADLTGRLASPEFDPETSAHGEDPQRPR